MFNSINLTFFVNSKCGSFKLGQLELSFIIQSKLTESSLIDYEFIERKLLWLYGKLDIKTTKVFGHLNVTATCDFEHLISNHTH